jgi:hypothetical protein
MPPMLRNGMRPFKDSRIADGTCYNPNCDTRKDPKAFHVETAKENKEQIKTVIHNLYGAKAKTFPLHQRMRFVPTIQDLVDMSSLEKLHELRNRQDGWCRQHEARISTSFTVIDRKMKDSDFTLRDMIMSLPATTGNTKTSLFQSIDKAMKGAGFTLSFHPNMAAKAVMGIRGLYLRLLAKYGKGINSSFTADALDAGIKMEWDPKTKKVSSEDDKELACTVGMDNDMDIAPPTASSNLEAELPMRLTTYQPERGEEDSVSTLGTKRSAKDSAQPFKEACTHEVCTEVLTDHDLASDTSSLTTGTARWMMPPASSSDLYFLHSN